MRYDHLWDNTRGVCKRCGVQSSESPGPCVSQPTTIESLRIQNGALRTLNRSLEEKIKIHREKAREYHEAIQTLDSEREANARLTERAERLEAALEWALDHATDSDHPHYPERVLPRTAYAVWHYPYLVIGTPMGGGVGHANFPSALEAVESARQENRS